MNVFYTNSDPIICASEHNAVHVRKMIVEYTQLLSTAHRVLDGTPIKTKSASGRMTTNYVLMDTTRNCHLYKATHVNHPSAQWVRASHLHYQWLFQCTRELCAIYFKATGKMHKTYHTLLLLARLPDNIPCAPWQDPFVAINVDLYPDAHLESTVLQKYRTYMQLKLNEWIDKGRRITWYTEQPQWLVLKS